MRRRTIGISRREFLAATAGATLLARPAFSAAGIQPPAARPKIKTEDAQFLEDCAKRCFRFFWEQADEHSGMVMDRSRDRKSVV